MFVVALKTLLTDAMKQTFDEEHPHEDFRNLLVSIELPKVDTDVPSIWVDVSFAKDLEIAGIHQREHVENEDGDFKEFTRWTTAGHVSYTAMALTSLERDRLFDEMVKVMAFGHENNSTSQFRSYIESNEFIAINIDFDQIRIDGFANAPGTPWGSDEMVYEATISMEFVGEFVSDGRAGLLVPLSAIEVTSYRVDEPDPTIASEEPNPWM